jgi:hypothetical protein
MSIDVDVADQVVEPFVGGQRCLLAGFACAISSLLFATSYVVS